MSVFCFCFCFFFCGTYDVANGFVLLFLLFLLFPPIIVVTAKRPDVTIYSTSEKKCVVIELTVPAEENLAQANNRKKCKYADLIHECQEAGWDVRYFPVEVGSRGFTNQTLRACFKYLDLSNKEIRLAIDEISKTALSVGHQMEQVVVCLVTRIAEILPQFSTRYSTFSCKPENLE